MATGYFAGCFINVDKEIKGQFSERLMAKEQPVIHKFLEIYKKTLANDNADVSFDASDREDGGIQFLLEKLRATELKNEDLNMILFEKLRDCLPDNNYVATLVYNSYDVPEKTSDKRKVDDASSELYRHIILSVCPVKTQKGTLGYLTEKEQIGENPQQLIVDKPQFGLIYPAFNDRSPDTTAASVYRTEKLDLSDSLLGHKAPELIKKVREKKVKAPEETHEGMEGSVMAGDTTAGRIAIRGGSEGTRDYSSRYGDSTAAIPSLDTGTLNNDAHYISETLKEDPDSAKDYSREPSDAALISSIGKTVKADNRSGEAAPKKRRPVRITGDESLIEKKIIDGRVYYLIAAQDAEISAG